MNRSRSTTHFDLLDAFAKPGCPVCRLTVASVERYLESINYEYVNDPAFRAAIEPAWGFCAPHAELWLKRAHPLGTALIYGAVLDRVLRELEDVHPVPRGGLMASVAARLGAGAGEAEACGVLEPPGRCPACRVRDETVDLLIGVLVTALEEPDARSAYRHSDTLCLPHLRLALCRGMGDEAFAALVEGAREREQRLRAQLHEVVRKHDHRFRAEPMGTERGAVEGAVHHVAAADGAI